MKLGPFNYVNEETEKNIEKVEFKQEKIYKDGKYLG